MNFLRSAMIAAGSLMLCQGAAQADKLALSSFLEPNHMISLHLHKAWADDMRQASGGKLDFELFLSGALMPPLSHLSGVGNGLAQAGIVGGPYTPADLPIANTIGEMGFTNPDDMVLGFAITDFMTHEKVALDEWKNNNVVFGVGFANPDYYFLCRQDISTLEDMSGKRVRTSGGGWARLAEAIGMVPVNLPSSEIYTGMERGALDCANADITHLTSGATIMDLTKSVVMLSTQPAYISPGLVYNRDWWASLTQEERSMVFEASARALAGLQVNYTAEIGKVMEIAKAAGVKFNTPDAAMLAARDNWVADGVGDMAGVARANYGVTDPEPLYTLFQTYLDKWAGLLANEDRNDLARITELVRVNLYDTLDPVTYGVE